MTNMTNTILDTLRHDPSIAFDLVVQIRDMPAIRPASIRKLRMNRAHTGLDGIRRSMQPDLAFVANAERPSERIRWWAVLVDVLACGTFDADRIWAWPFVHATVRQELAIPTLHLVIAEQLGVIAQIHAAFAWEPDLLPVVVGSLPASAVQARYLP